MDPTGLPDRQHHRQGIVRAHRWRDMLEAGGYATLRDLAKAERINESYLGRVLRLTLLAPSTIEGILHGQQPAGLELEQLLKPIPAEWGKRLFVVRQFETDQAFREERLWLIRVRV
jgi:hypothetical protein